MGIGITRPNKPLQSTEHLPQVQHTIKILEPTRENVWSKRLASLWCQGTKVLDSIQPPNP